MTRHLELYLKFNGYDDPDEVVCEVSGRPAHLGGVDISHNRARQAGYAKKIGGEWNDRANTKENLMALARPLHTFLEENPSYYWWFHLTHCAFLVTKQPYVETLAGIDDPILKDIITKIAS